MIVLSFVLFAALVIAWLAAPTTATAEAQAPAASLKLSETPA